MHDEMSIILLVGARLIWHEICENSALMSYVSSAN